jgi:surface antigen
MSVSPDLSLGKVLANVNSKAYTTTGGDRFSEGQCTWYCCGRAKEKYKIDLVPLLPSSGANGNVWYDKVKTNSHVTKRPVSAGPVTDCIASFAHDECGHVVFIECVKDGYVYFTECNWKLAQNGKLQKIAVSDFPTLHGCKLNGYIVIR